MSRTHRRPMSSPVAAAARSAVEQLETRQLFAATLAGPLPDIGSAAGGTQQTVDLQPFFNDPKYSVVRLTTTAGVVDVQTLDEQVPLNAANFLNYVNSGRYNNAIFHRNIDDFVLQGGSFDKSGNEIAADAPVVDEPSPFSNVRGTLAFARVGPENGGGPDTATNGFFFNLSDNNASNLDNQNGGFAVFGLVRGNGMTVVDALTQQGSFNSQGTITSLTGAPAINTAALTDDVTYTAQSSDPAVVTPTIVDGNLLLTYGTGGGTATVTVTATDLDGVTTASDAFDVTVTPGAPFAVVLGGEDGVKTATFAEADGTQVSVAVKGSGTATLSFGGESLTQTAGRGRTEVGGTNVSLANVAVAGGDATTTVTVTSKGGSDGTSTLGSLTTDAAVKSITAKGSVLTGALTTAGAVGSLTLAGASGGTITLGGAAADRGSSLTFGTLANTAITSTGTVKTAKLVSGTGTLTLSNNASLLSLTSAGDLALDVTAGNEGNIGKVSVGGNLTGDLTAHQIGSVNVRGAVTGSTITANHGANETGGFPDTKLNQGVQAVKVKGAMNNAVINSAGTIGTVSAASITGGRIVAGAPNLTALPSSAGAIPQDAAILSLKSKSFASALVVASRLGKLNVGTVTTANGGAPFGFAGNVIAALAGTADTTRFSVRNADDQADADAALTGVTLGDLVVRVL